MKQRIIKSLTIDNFITYQNGNLVKDFYTNTENVVDINKYNTTKLFTQINLDNEKSRLINDIAKIKKEDILPKQIIPEKLTLWMRIKKVMME